MTPVARILVGLVLVGGSMFGAYMYDPPERERVAWLCSADRPSVHRPDGRGGRPVTAKLASGGGVMSAHRLAARGPFADRGRGACSPAPALLPVGLLAAGRGSGDDAPVDPGAVPVVFPASAAGLNPRVDKDRPATASPAAGRSHRAVERETGRGPTHLSLSGLALGSPGRPHGPGRPATASVPPLPAVGEPGCPTHERKNPGRTGDGAPRPGSPR